MKMLEDDILPEEKICEITEVSSEDLSLIKENMRNEKHVDDQTLVEISKKIMEKNRVAYVKLSKGDE